MRRTVYVIFIILLSLTISYLAEDNDKLGDEANSRIVFGENHAFIVMAPEGWVLDNSSGVNQGLHAVFYPKGGSWEESSTVMYTQGVDIEDTLTLKSFIKKDIEKFKKKYPEIEIEELDSILIEEDERVAKVGHALLAWALSDRLGVPGAAHRFSGLR